MAKCIVDALKVIEVDVKHGNAVIDRALCSGLQVGAERQAVGETCEIVMMSHVTDAGLRALVLGHVDNGDKPRGPSTVFERARIGRDVDRSAIRLDMLPIAFPQYAAFLLVFLGPSVFRQFDVADAHRQEAIAVIAVQPDCRIVDREDLERFAVMHPHRHWIAVEQQSE